MSGGTVGSDFCSSRSLLGAGGSLWSNDDSSWCSGAVFGFALLLAISGTGMEEVVVEGGSDVYLYLIMAVVECHAKSRPFYLPNKHTTTF